MTGGGTDRGAKRLYLVVGVVAVAIVALIAYLMWPRTPDHVLIVGDSVTFQSWDELQDRFGSGTDLEAMARPGFRSTDLLPLVREAVDNRAAAGHPLDRAIFLVGYNDVWLEHRSEPDLRALVDLAARHECAVWLTLPVRPGGSPPAIGTFDVDLADDWNDLLDDLVGDHENIHLVTDWADAVEDAPADTYLTADGIHPNGAGQELLAEVMYDAVVSACRFP